MTDYKQLCAELVAWAEKTSAHYYVPPEVLVRARAELTKPEPEEPTDEDSLPTTQEEAVESLNRLSNIKSRIEELQEEIRDLRISYVRLANAVAYIMPDRNKFFADLIPDFDDPS